MCVGGKGDTCTCTRAQRGQMLMSSLIALHLLLDHDLSLNLEFMDSTRLAGQWVPGICLSLPQQLWGQRYEPSPQTSTQCFQKIFAMILILLPLMIPGSEEAFKSSSLKVLFKKSHYDLVITRKRLVKWNMVQAYSEAPGSLFKWGQSFIVTIMRIWNCFATLRYMWLY